MIELGMLFHWRKDLFHKPWGIGTVACQVDLDGTIEFCLHLKEICIYDSFNKEKLVKNGR